MQLLSLLQRLAVNRPFYIRRDHTKFFHPKGLKSSKLFRLFFIFSGYSDGAIGLSRIMGIRTPENFRYPLLATNLVDFWRRWHISMGVWLRDYIYIPLGGYRNPIFATAVVFAYCGLWHFPAYWGAGFFVLVQTTSITITRKWRARQKARGNEATQDASGIRARVFAVLGWVLTQHIMVFTVLYVLDHIHSGLRVMGRMFGLYAGNAI